MRWIFAFILSVHGLLHLLGVFKAFGSSKLHGITQPITRPMGVVWALSAIMCLATVVTVFAAPRSYWLVGTVALVLSQLAIFSAFHDAKFGSLANVVLLLGVLYGYFNEGPGSFRAQYEQDTQEGMARPVDSPVLTEAELAQLPEPVRRYLRATGFVGKPRVRNYRLHFTGRIRSAPDADWMPFEADQQSFADEPTRLFWMRAQMFGLPVQVFHRLRDGKASMRVKLVGILPMVNASGPTMDQSETVTLFNDMCILAPGTLIDPSIVWEAVDARTARARFTNGGQTIAATLLFDDRGLLKDFISDDRSQASPDGKAFTRMRFSTPVSDYRQFGPYRLAAKGLARWHAPQGEFSYGEFMLTEIAYNVDSGKITPSGSLPPR